MANDLAVGLKLGLDAARMAGAWDEADLDRTSREKIAGDQLTFKKGESETAGERWKIEQDNLKLHQEKVYKSSENARIAKGKHQALMEKQGDRSFTANEKYRQDMRDAEAARKKAEADARGATAAYRAEQQKQAGVAAGLEANFKEQMLGYQEQRLEQEALFPIQKYNVAINKETEKHDAAQSEIDAGLAALNSQVRAAGTLRGPAVQEWQTNRSHLMAQRKRLQESYDRSIKDLNDLKEFEKKKGGPKVDIRLVPVTDPNTRVITMKPQVSVQGNIGSEAAKEVTSQIIEIQKQLQTGMNPLGNPSGAPGGGGAGTPPAGAPPVPPSTPGYGQPGNAIQ